MTVIHGSYSVIELGVLILWVFAAKCAAMDLSDMDKLLGEAVAGCLVRRGRTVKEAAAVMGIDESQFRKALRGESYRLLALNHLIKLGPLFMADLCESLMWLTMKQRAHEIMETVIVRNGA